MLLAAAWAIHPAVPGEDPNDFFRKYSDVISTLVFVPLQQLTPVRGKSVVVVPVARAPTAPEEMKVRAPLKVEASEGSGGLGLSHPHHYAGHLRIFPALLLTPSTLQALSVFTSLRASDQYIGFLQSQTLAGISINSVSTEYSDKVTKSKVLHVW
ncbi:hypothetical protein K443DRAFT_3911 [Laccaria amethystina LaAM-08-1]|uniref:Uncharacterized protein n=1 Tax=Laccaria amethystina LaAM-08-1 TaxID=1095629 RepID=A0A0C9X032_9AGAR|nr:hypothetical protein K443DRAFT_3911 [Laccaria amethystina LaAM-08-1]